MKFKKTLAVILSALMLFSTATVTFAAGEAGNDINYTISNPYAGVNFETDKAYKADLHSHTTFSDGHETLPAMAERHYDLGFDIYAVTDHSSTHYSFTENNFVPAMRVISLVKNEFLAEDVLLATGGTTANGNAYQVRKDEATKDEYYSQTIGGVQGHEMMGVPFGNEQNGTSFNNAHINTWFADWGHGRFGGTSEYEKVISSIDGLGGLSVINHPGEYTNARDVVYTKDAYNKDDVMFNYYINKYENLLLKYDSCLGIDINSKGDSRTRFDRKLWDTLLTDLLPYGRNVFAIATTDAHNLDVVDSGFTMHYMPSLTSANLKANMQAGAFFPSSKCVGNFDELVILRNELKALTDNAEAQALATELDGIIAASEIEMANGDSGRKYEAEENETAPLFTNVVVDEENDTITLEAKDALTIHWIANGKVIHVGNSIDLDDYSADIKNYVRAEAYGIGGVCYTQPFALEYDGAPKADIEDRDLFFDWGKIVTVICDIPVRAIIAILPKQLLVSIISLFMGA